MKTLIVLLDGLSDEPQGALGGQTPLEAAATPFLDELARGGLQVAVNLDVGRNEVSTEVGSALWLGVLPEEVRDLRRGPVEAAGIGLDLAPDDIALRCNIATIEDRGGEVVVVDRRAGRITTTDALTRDLALCDEERQISARLYPGTGHRAVLVLRGRQLSPAVSDADPLRRPLPAAFVWPRPLDSSTAARRTASFLEAYLRHAHRRLVDHPVNELRRREGKPPATGLLTRQAGRLRPLRRAAFIEPLGPALVAGEMTLLGLARLSGASAVSQPSFTGRKRSDVTSKVRRAIELLDNHPLVYLHVKAPDLYGHDRDPLGKAACIAEIDRALRSLAAVPDLRIVVTADHGTNSATGLHMSAPVPALVWPWKRAPSNRGWSDRPETLSQLPHRSVLDVLRLVTDAPSPTPRTATDQRVHGKTRAATIPREAFSPTASESREERQPESL